MKPATKFVQIEIQIFDLHDRCFYIAGVKRTKLIALKKRLLTWRATLRRCRRQQVTTT